MMPGIISGFLLAFIVSLDDFIITNFVKGAGVETLPTAIFGSVKQGLNPTSWRSRPCCCPSRL
jgi:spermidine/putrescine transport system permease protein